MEEEKFSEEKKKSLLDIFATSWVRAGQTFLRAFGAIKGTALEVTRSVFESVWKSVLDIPRKIEEIYRTPKDYLPPPTSYIPKNWNLSQPYLYYFKVRVRDRETGLLEDRALSLYSDKPLTKRRSEEEMANALSLLWTSPRFKEEFEDYDIESIELDYIITNPEQWEY